MNKELTKNMTVGSMVAEDFNRAQVFEQLGIDYCCHGSDTLEEACTKTHLNPDDVLAKLNDRQTVGGGAPDFANWPLDLLVDYVLKYHHRNFHLHHDALLQLVNKVASVHGGRHPELLQIRDLVTESFEELDSHFAKEENILFPQLYEIYNAHEEERPAAPFHCGSIAPPIHQMMLEHDTAGDTWQHITELSHHFETPADGCSSYRLMNQQLKQFFLDLKEHISLENNLIFPGFLRMEQQAI
ncbi:MAG: iron-sulfur cluster repair di-iron protein [Prevotella sp.]|nr:iron-sulfur cluster repair di-iron protein [Prevotella sp.]